MDNYIDLKEREPLTKGNSRFVYQHPTEPDYLIKVVRPEVIESRFGSGAKWYKGLRRFRQYLSYHREIEEYIAVYVKRGDAAPFLQEIIGFTHTNYGLGLVIRAVKSPDGKLAPSLSDLLKKHLVTPKVTEALEACFAEILESNVIISDLNVGNFVYVEEENRFIMIDGLGNANPISLKAYSQGMNRRAKKGRFERFRKRIARYKAEYQHP